MTPTAKVYKHPRSPFWQAWFLSWSAERREWVATMKSTRSRDETDALGIARELERVALEASGQTGAVIIGQDWATSAVNQLLQRAGIREVAIGKPWDDYAAAWLKMKERKTKPRTIMAYATHIKLFSSWLGSKKTLPLSAITGEMAQKWYECMSDEGRSSVTINNAATTIGCIFDRAREEGFCQRNPVQLIDRQTSTSNERDEFTAGDISKLLVYLRRDPELEDWLTVVLLGLCTGQRLMDCANAQWAHVEEGSPWWTWVLQQGKTSTKVRVPIVEPLASHLRTLKRKAASLFLSPSLAGTQRGLSDPFSNLLAKVKIAGTQIKGRGKKGRTFNSKTFHSFRHTCNSLLANSGVSPDVRMAILGHSTKKMNQRYTHLSDATTGDALVQAITKAVP